MDTDVLETLEELGCPEVTAAGLTSALDAGPASAEFRRLLVWLAAQLTPLCQLEATLPAEADAADLQLELSGLLRELHCPHAALLEGPVQARLETRAARLTLLDFLCGELQAARMLAVDTPAVTNGVSGETPTAAALKRMLLTLNFPKPPANISPAQLFSKLELKLKDLAAAAPAELVGVPLWSCAELSDKQWRHLEKTMSELELEYRLRREMLLKRLDVTVQSFRWSPRAQQRQEEVLAAFSSRRSALSRQPVVQIAHLLSARRDLAVEERTCSSQVRRNTRTGLNRVVIGPVPDRGGRPSEQRAPPPEMPSWKPRDGGGGGGRGRGGGEYRGGGRGGDYRGGGRGGDYRGGGRGGGEYRGGGRGGGGDYRGGGRGGGGEYRGGGHRGGGGRGGFRGRGGRVQGAGWTRGGRGGGGGY